MSGDEIVARKIRKAFASFLEIVAAPWVGGLTVAPGDLEPSGDKPIVPVPDVTPGQAHVAYVEGRLALECLCDLLPDNPECMYRALDVLDRDALQWVAATLVWELHKTGWPV